VAPSPRHGRHEKATALRNGRASLRATNDNPNEVDRATLSDSFRRVFGSRLFYGVLLEHRHDAPPSGPLRPLRLQDLMQYVVAGAPESSYLMRKIEDAVPGCDLTCMPPPVSPMACSSGAGRMPQGGPYLPADQQSVIRDWIKQGANQ
jgi:hypothetical protein